MKVLNLILVKSWPRFEHRFKDLKYIFGLLNLLFVEA